MSVLFDLLIDFVYPKTCAVCGKLGSCICDDCLRSLEYSEQICPICGEPSAMGWTHEKCRNNRGLEGLVTVYDYQDDAVRRVIKVVKFGFDQELLRYLIEKCEMELGMPFDLITPVPLHFYRYNWRGFNQSEVIAKEIAKQSGTVVDNLLKRRKRTRQQSMSDSLEMRKKNVSGVFEVADPNKVKSKKILLVDDVYTSGATMNEAAKTLKRAGAELVWGFCLAH